MKQLRSLTPLFCSVVSVSCSVQFSSVIFKVAEVTTASLEGPPQVSARCKIIRLSGYDCLKRDVFDRRRKTGSDGAVAASSGNSFNVPLTLTTHRPTLLVTTRYQYWADTPDVTLTAAFTEQYWLWPPYVIGQAIIFLPCGYYLSIYLFFLA